MDIDTKPTLNHGSQSASDLAFIASFPLPYRILFLIGGGILGWATNLHFLSVLGIDTGYALEIRYNTAGDPSSSPLPSNARNSSYFNSFAHPGSLHRPIYRIFAYYATWTLISWFLFRLWSGANPESVDKYKILPTLTAIVVFAVLFCPLNIVQKAERLMFLRGFTRCITSPSHLPIHFSDVVLADIFTSYAKVIGDLWVAARMLFPSGSLVRWPDDYGVFQWVVPCMMSLPYLMRFRQCIVEYKGNNGSSSRPLFNAIKYATAFPVIFLSAAQRLILEDAAKRNNHGEIWHGEYQLFRLWLLSVFVNSMYSFWWDVTNDWGLELLRPSTWSQPHFERPLGASLSPPRPLVLPTLHANGKVAGSASFPRTIDLSSPRHSSDEPPRAPRVYFGLRKRLLFGDTLIYYIAILFNLILRFTWSLKLSSHLHNVTDMESGVFAMEALEILRRWVWVFLRVEWEVQRKQDFMSPNGRRLGENPEEYEFLLRGGDTSDSGG